MTSPVAAPAPRPLKPKSERGLIAHVRRLLRRAAPRAEVIAPPEVHLGAFLTYELDRRMPDRSDGGSMGRGSVVLTAPAVPTLAGRVNEIAWAIVVEAAFQANAIWRGEFPVVVLPMRS